MIRKLYPLVLVDVALFSVADKRLQVLLVRRAQEPEAGRWALPGGALKPEEDHDLEAAARRELRRKVDLDIPHVEEVGTVSGPDRDPRGWSISVLFYALLPRDQFHAVVKDKVEAIEWVDVAKPRRRLAFDHGVQLAKALQALREKIARKALPLHLMPERFTLTALQQTCEAILDQPLEKSAFRRHLRGSTDLIDLGEQERERGRQRPAQYYRARPGFTFSK